MAASEASAVSCCAHCGVQGMTLKRCKHCMQVWYCGAQCQKAEWKVHKNTCMSIDDIGRAVWAAHSASDWKGVLLWEGRMEELLEDGKTAEDNPDNICCCILEIFANAHELQTGPGSSSRFHAIEAVKLQKRRIELLGKMERFRDQGDVLCSIALILGAHVADEKEDEKEVERYYSMARTVGAQHGFFALECRACLGLGQLAALDGRPEEALELLRNSLAAAPLTEDERGGTYEMVALDAMSTSLFHLAR